MFFIWIFMLVIWTGFIGLSYWAGYRRGKIIGGLEVLENHVAEAPEINGNIAEYISSEIQYAIDHDHYHIGPFYFEPRNDDSGIVDIKGFKQK